MSGMQTELATLEARLEVEPWNADIIRRRIAEVRAAIRSTPATPAPAPEAAVEPMEVETATIPKAKRTTTRK